MNRICRTCLEWIPAGSLFFQLDGKESSAVAMLIKSQLRACVPEVSVGVVKDPVLCSLCLDELTSAYKFKSRCLQTEKHILDYILHSPADLTYVDMNLVVKRVASSGNAAAHSKSDICSGSPLLSNDKLPGKIGSFRECKRKYEEIKKDCRAKIIQGDNRTTNKSFTGNCEDAIERKNSFPNFKSTNIKVVGPFSDFISVDSLSSPIISGIRKEAHKYPQFTIQSILGDCIDILDESDLEASSDGTVSSHDSDDISSLEDSMDLLRTSVGDRNAESNLEKGSCGIVEDQNRIEDGLGRVTLRENSKEVEVRKADILSSNSNFISPVNSTNIVLERSSNKLPFKQHNKTENSFRIVSPRSDFIKQANALTDLEEIPPQLVSANVKNASLKEVPRSNEDVVRTDSQILCSLKDFNKAENCAKTVSPSSNLVNRMESSLNENSNPECCIVTTNVHVAKTDVLREGVVAGRVTSLQECSVSDPVKEECETGESPTEDECRAIEIKDEVVIKDECEFQQYKNKVEELHSNNSCNGLIGSDVESSSLQSAMEVDNLQLQSAEVATWQQLKNSAFFTSSSDGSSSNEDFRSRPSRFVKRGHYSCAVCGYSCNSERVLIAHTKIHTGKRSNKSTYKDSQMFRGFSRAELKRERCVRCKYGKSLLWLMWLKPAVVLTRWKPK